MTMPPQKTPGISPSTWAMWVVALSPVLQLIGIAIIDVNGYFRALLDLGTQARSGATPGALPAGFGSAVLSFLVGGLVAFVAQVLLVVFAAVDWSILRRRGIDRPFHWAWSFFVLTGYGSLVYPIGRTVVAQNRTSRPAWVPMLVFIVLSVAGFVFSLVKTFGAFAQFASQLQGVS